MDNDASVCVCVCVCYILYVHFLIMWSAENLAQIQLYLYLYLSLKHYLSFLLSFQTAYHGFPSSPTAISFEPEDQFLSIGTKTGEFRIYGRPGVEFHAQLDSGAEIQEIFSLKGLHQFITVSVDNRLILWQLEGEEGAPCELKAIKDYHLDPDG